MNLLSTLSRPALATALGLLATVGSVHAIESGAPILPFGVYDFGSGQLPPPSDVATVGVRVAAYSATDLRGNDGSRSPLSLNLKVNSAGVAIIKMTDTPLLGGTWGYSAVIPVLDMKNDLTIPTPGGPLNLSGKNAAQGDIQISPVIISWTPSPGLYANAGLQLQLPTGSYDKTRLINAGTNHWSLTPNAAFTWIQPSGFEISSYVHLNFNSRNSATDYRSGAEFQHEFSLGQHLGPWTLGLAGYRVQQISDDSGSGAAAPNVPPGNRSRVTALGPAVSFFDLGSDWPLVWVHAYKEFGARNRSQGQQVTVRAAWTF
jgi:hypothetical protein